MLDDELYTSRVEKLEKFVEEVGLSPYQKETLYQIARDFFEYCSLITGFAVGEASQGFKDPLEAKLSRSPLAARLGDANTRIIEIVKDLMRREDEAHRQSVKQYQNVKEVIFDANGKPPEPPEWE